MYSDNRLTNPIFEITEDGSHTLFVPELNEHYHSTHGALQESMHIFIKDGLLYKLQSQHTNQLEQESLQINEEKNHQTASEHEKQPSTLFTLLEIGFGTGLNALLTLLEAEKREINLFYHTLERYPISLEAAQQLNYPVMLKNRNFNIAVGNLQQNNQYNLTAGNIDYKTIEQLFLQLHTAQWEQATTITPHFTMLKQEIDFSNPTTFLPEKSFDLIYFDAFAPEKQPEMWTQEIFDYLYSISNQGAILTTYCAKGVVRRMLQTAGFQVARLPGPPGKREILRATKLD